QAYCTPQDSTFMQGNTPIFPASGTWSVINGAGLFADVHDPLSKVVGMAIGANTFVWTTSNGPCPNAITMDTMTVIIYSDSTAAAFAGDDFELCLPMTSVQLQAATPQPPATGTWTILSGPGTLVDPNDPHTVVNDLALGITTFVWTLNNGPCPTSGIWSDTVSVSVFDPFGPVANAGPDISQCTPEDSTVMAANIPLFPATGTWHLVSGTGVIADSTDHATAIHGLSVGANVFTWTIYNGDCGFGPPTTDTVVVYLYDQTAPVADAGADQDLCSSATNVVLAGNAAVYPGTGTWTALGGATVADAANPQSAVGNLSIGDNQFVWTVDNGPCGTTVDTVLLRVFDGTITAANAGPSQDLCSPVASASMAAGAATYPSTGAWAVVSGTGSFSNAADPQAIVTGMAPGVNVYAWTLNNGPCGALTDTITVTIFDGSITAANAGPDQDICGPVTSATLAASPVAAPATGSWSIVSGAGSLSDPSNAGAVLNGLITGQTILAWTISNGPCTSGALTDTVVITVYDGASQPNADAGPDQQFCEPGSVDADMFANEAVFPATGTWSIAGSGTITDPTNRNTTVTGIGFGTTTLTWTIDNGVCGSTSDDMTVSVFDNKVPPAAGGPDQLICQDTTTATMAAVPATSTATGHWELLEGHGTISDPAQPNTGITGLQPGNNIFSWVVDNGACGTTADTVVITLHDCSILVVPDAFSPNGDGVNDTYVVDGLSYYPNNSFKVFNRWGSKVYERSPYRNDWDGKNEGKPGLGTNLPESTYYFILDPGDGKEVITGYIYLRR
ncbi:MAG: gliding motility-associated C-terminal domain-containing protein, partial [Bacteroidetes bacterium]|nr:gliding motility-associated C-terminal domain-containing protein [Bacteroidota bacterium]